MDTLVRVKWGGLKAVDTLVRVEQGEQKNTVRIQGAEAVIQHTFATKLSYQLTNHSTHPASKQATQ